jgi:hypothetical protein
MICPYCGNENPDNLEICAFCGGPLHPASAEPVIDENPLEPKVTIVDTPTQPEIPPPQPEVFTPQQADILTPTPPVKNRNRIWWLVGCVVLVLIFLCCGISILVGYRAVRQFGTNLSPTLITDYSVNLVSTVIPNQLNNVLFADDFSDPNSGWDIVDTTNYYSDYYQNSYRMIINTDMSDSWANPGNNVFTDVTIEVDATKNAGPDDNDFGVICRYQNENEFYYAVISSDGFYGILKVTSDSTTQLGFDELQPSNAIDQGTTTNKLRFDCVGDVLTLYVNGQQIDRQIDSTYSAGNVGLIAGTYDTPGTDILFDNFIVTQP